MGLCVVSALLAVIPFAASDPECTNTVVICSELEITWRTSTLFVDDFAFVSETEVPVNTYIESGVWWIPHPVTGNPQHFPGARLTVANQPVNPLPNFAPTSPPLGLETAPFPTFEGIVSVTIYGFTVYRCVTVEDPLTGDTHGEETCGDLDLVGDESLGSVGCSSNVPAIQGFCNNL